MILQWLVAFIIDTFNKQPEIRDQTTIEIIESVVLHFKTINSFKVINKFMVYDLPCKSYRDFKAIVNDFIVSIEMLETPKTIKLQTIKYTQNNYVRYFKKGLNETYKKDEIKNDIFFNLNKIKNHLEKIDEAKNESYSYYSSRTELILEHYINLLEILTHE